MNRTLRQRVGVAATRLLRQVGRTRTRTRALALLAALLLVATPAAAASAQPVAPAGSSPVTGVAGVAAAAVAPVAAVGDAVDATGAAALHTTAGALAAVDRFLAGADRPDRGACAGLYRIRVADTELCSPGATPLPAGDRGRAPAPHAAVPGGPATAPVVCDGDGVSGKRVETLYVRERSTPSRYALFLPSFRAWAQEIDAAYNDSAAGTGGSRHLRFVTDPVAGGCEIRVTEVVVADGALGTWQGGIDALQARGFDRADRKYLVYADAQVVCGVGTLYADDTAGPGNDNNVNTGYARIDASPNCWGFNAAAHELGHTLGAVQESAPNAEGAHCVDDWDLMCYSAQASVLCAAKDSDRLLDCHHDDYFHTSPPAGSYLATHWNVADSDWLIHGDFPDPGPGPRHGETFIVTNVETRMAMDVVDASVEDLAMISARAPNGRRSQQWMFKYETGWQMSNVKSGKCADSAFSGTEPGTLVLQYTCNAQDSMRWTVRRQRDGSVALINVLSGLAATSGGKYPAALEQRRFTGEPNQLWQLDEVW